MNDHPLDIADGVAAVTNLLTDLLNSTTAWWQQIPQSEMLQEAFLLSVILIAILSVVLLGLVLFGHPPPSGEGDEEPKVPVSEIRKVGPPSPVWRPGHRGRGWLPVAGIGAFALLAAGACAAIWTKKAHRSRKRPGEGASDGYTIAG